MAGPAATAGRASRRAAHAAGRRLAGKRAAAPGFGRRRPPAIGIRREVRKRQGLRLAGDGRGAGGSAAAGPDARIGIVRGNDNAARRRRVRRPGDRFDGARGGRGRRRHRIRRPAPSSATPGEGHGDRRRGGGRQYRRPLPSGPGASLRSRLEDIRGDRVSRSPANTIGRARYRTIAGSRVAAPHRER